MLFNSIYFNPKTMIKPTLNFVLVWLQKLILKNREISTNIKAIKKICVIIFSLFFVAANALS